MNRRLAFTFACTLAFVVNACAPKEKSAVSESALQQFAIRYTAAWCSARRSPDGRFLTYRVVGASGPLPRLDDLILVENFSEELKAKVRPK